MKRAMAYSLIFYLIGTMEIYSKKITTFVSVSFALLLEDARREEVNS